MGIDVTGIGDRHQLPGGRVQRSQNIEPLPAGRSFDEAADKGPQETKKGLQDKMGSIDEKQVALIGLSFGQAWCQVLIQKCLLFLRVSLGWYLTNCASLQPQLFQKLSYLGRTTAQTGQFFDTLYRLINGRRRSLVEFLTQAILVAIQVTLGLMKVQHFERLNPPLLVHLEILTQRRLADTHDATDFLVRQAERLQVHRLHPLAHTRMGMVGAFVV